MYKSRKIYFFGLLGIFGKSAREILFKEMMEKFSCICTVHGLFYVHVFLSYLSQGVSRMVAMSLTSLRGKLFKVVDEVIRTGIPAEIERKGQRVKIVPETKKSKLDNLKPHDCIVGDPDDLIALKVAPWHEPDHL